MATANWPRLRLGPLSVASPGDWLLPRAAHVLSCYPVSFQGSNPAYTGRTIRQLLRDSRTMDRLLGIFPEGVVDAAGRIADPLPGVGRLLQKLDAIGLPPVPIAVFESGGGLRIRIGAAIACGLVPQSPDPARLCLARIRELLDT